MENNMPYQAIKQITNNYDKRRILGSGGFGTVYKGALINGVTIAVKVFDARPFDDSEFVKEFDNLKRLSHQNIVQLLGFCNDTEEVYAEVDGKQVPAVKLHMALCLEYVQNGTLGTYITDEPKDLRWQTRYKIIKGVCEGLKYLHEGINPPILHLDLKPQNILLDKDMIPKVADFGLSRLFGELTTTITASTRGTIGYVPPEYTDYQVISDKYDIYSLGVIMAKTITGKKLFSRIGDLPRKEFINQVHDNWRKQLRQYLNPAALQVECHQVRRCIELALHCMKKNRLERPTIQEIVSNLIETETMIGNLGLNIEQFPPGESCTRTDFPDNPSSGNDRGAIKRKLQKSMPSTMIELPRHLPFDFLTRITDDFSAKRKLGEDLFRTVYKGILNDGQVIAVTRFEPDSPFGRDRRFTDKVQSLFVFNNHENIVKTIGYCRESRRILVLYEGRYLAADIEETLLCHEYFNAGSLAEYIYGESCRDDWNMSFNIIMGICQGLRFLHTEFEMGIIQNILKPENIFLDNNMVPKILDYCQSKHYEETLRWKKDAVGPIGYIAPECLYNGKLSSQTDIYSLGVIMLEVIAGGRNHNIIDQIHSGEFVENVCGILTNEYIASAYPSLDACGCEHLKKCAAIGLQCVELDHRKRPSIVEIVDKLNILSKELVNNELFEVQPRELCFRLEPTKQANSCSLQLRNKGEDQIAFMLVTETPKRYLTKLPLCGIVPPSCTYTHMITMRKQTQQLSEDSNGDSSFTLHISPVGNFGLQNVDKGSIAEKYIDFFHTAKEVQETRLMVNCYPPVHEPTRSIIEILTNKNAMQISSIDVHPTQPWILTTHKGGNLHVFDYNIMDTLTSFEDVTEESVHIAKFVEREKWLVAGDVNGGIHVYSYEEHEEVIFLQAHYSCILSLDLHPTLPFLLSASEDSDHLIKLWEWDKNKKWKCTRTFQGHVDKVIEVTFNSNSTNSFTSVSLDGTVKIWSIDKDGGDHVTLNGKDESLICAKNFKRHNRQHLIAGCMDGTAQVWNMEMKARVQRLEGHGGRITVINLHQELPMLITGSFDGTVRLWNSDTYKILDIIDFNLGQVYAFGFTKDLRRIAVGCQLGLAVMEISSLVSSGCW